MLRSTSAALAALLFAAASTGPASAQFVHNTTSVPTGNVGYTENVDFGDVDGDGDWDAVFAEGGDWGNQQNRIWINQGGLQGGVLGTFVDETTPRMPVILDTSRDIEFADFDRDGDLDLNISNTSSVQNQPNRWWINMGGLQGGTAGFFQDQTAARWLNLGVHNTISQSSIPAMQVLPGGGFLDWSCDSDFGDIDNDGDLDIAHSTYGGAFSGNTPTRLFLNDGAGRFEEFNPSGFQLTTGQIQNGNPGLWASGLQQANTTNSSGAQCDIASSALDIDLADTDGDLDLDILHGARQELPRMFQNRLVENGGDMLPFRDVTGAVFPAGYSTGNGHYEQEMGDLDGDNDVDILGLNWVISGSAFNEVSLENSGNGVFTNVVPLPNSAPDDNEVDYLDYDMDGDLDLFIANFSGQDRLYRNDHAGAGLVFAHTTPGMLPLDNTTSLDADTCDVDSDGDTDVFVANTGAQPEWFLENTSTANDVRAPIVTRLEQAFNRAAGSAPTVLRAQVFDNAAYYTNWYNATQLEYSVNGGAFASVPMHSSAGQIFRGELPGNLVGTIDYRARSVDQYGNTGVSSTLTFQATPGCAPAPVVYCSAKLNSLGCLPQIGFEGTPSASAGLGFIVRGSLVRNRKSGLLIYSLAGRQNSPFQGGTLCVAMPIQRTLPLNSGGSTSGSDCTGVFTLDMNFYATGALGGSPPAALKVPGTLVNCQWWGRDSGFAAPNNTTLSDALEYLICQ